MNKAERKRLAAYYGLVESTAKQIENLEGLIRAISLRAKEQNNAGSLKVSVSYGSGRTPRGTYDNGWWGELPVYRLREAVLPVLHEALRELRETYRKLPKMRTEE